MTNHTAKGENHSSRLDRDCMNLSLSSGLFSLVARKTLSSKTASEYESRLSRLTINQLKIFGHIATNAGAEIRVKQLAHDLDITAAAASQSVERLVSVGMLERQTDTEDRRSTIITISARGQEILDEYRSIYSRLLGSIYDELDASEAEIETFGRMLMKIHAALKRHWEDYLASKNESGD